MKRRKTFLTHVYAMNNNSVETILFTLAFVLVMANIYFFLIRWPTYTVVGIYKIQQRCHIPRDSKAKLREFRKASHL
jgi:hypothetical protein